MYYVGSQEFYEDAKWVKKKMLKLKESLKHEL